MRRYLLTLATCLTVIACDDDSPEPAPPIEDASARDASRDAAPLDGAALDATVDAAVIDAAVADAAAADAAAADAAVADAAVADAAVADAAVVVDTATVDSAVLDAGLDAGSDAGQQDASMCVAEAERCDQSMCCEGAACVTSSEAAFNICAQKCGEDSECDSGCCTALPGSGADKVCAPQLHCANEAPELQPLQAACISPELIAGDGTYLGKVTARYDTEGVCNKNSEYGSFYGTNSIFNSSGKYGGFGQYSAYSTSAFSPPAIKCSSSGFAEAYVSKSTTPQNRRVIDPDDLCAVLELSNL